QTTQTIAFGVLSDRSFTPVPFGISATATSQLPVSFTSSTPAVCTAAGTSVTLVTIGMCSITASQAGSVTITAAAPVTQNFQVSQAAQTITFAAVGTITLPQAPFGLTVSVDSGLTLTIISNSTGVCTVNGATVTLVAVGTCSITASQA